MQISLIRQKVTLSNCGSSSIQSLSSKPVVHVNRPNHPVDNETRIISVLVGRLGVLAIRTPSLSFALQEKQGNAAVPPWI